MTGALSRLRVLDLTRVLAGPWCTQMLADLGADVIKVERPISGDDTRHWGPPWVGDADGRDTADSAYFTSANRNKRSVAVDLARPEGQALIKAIASRCDVLVENFKVGDLARYGLSYEDLRIENPRLIYCSVTGYGQDGPCADRPGYDFVFQGEGGLMSINGLSDDEAGGGPVKTSIAITDVLAGLNATIGILAAVESRNATGQGQHIDISLLDTIVHFGANQIASYFATGEIPRRWGNRHPNLTPYQTFPTADGHIIVACGNDGQFRKLCAALGREDLCNEERFRQMSARNVERKALEEILKAVFVQHGTSHWLKALDGIGVPIGAINNYQQVFEHPQVRHRELRQDLPHAAGGTVGTVKNPIRLSQTPVEYRLAPPLRGQHTRDVLSTVLGLDGEGIAALARAGVIETAAVDR
ncbi:CaiB/BaiF CoA-transferase family protein [Delftia tsuruhatensis]|uniref:CaiB/BaiF CoA transferase family protein n=1 Tax=Delftia tsuruhatensis TaxID=180282 RepID=UPI003D2459ED